MKRRVLCLLLSVIMVCGLLPTTALAEEQPWVRVIVENTTFPVDDFASWEGTLVDTKVPINEGSTMMSCVVDALSEGPYSQTGAEDNYISEINSLVAFEGGQNSGWMMTLNDWFINEGAGAFTVSNGKLKEGDEIRVLYTCELGEDLGGSWNNTDKTVKAIAVSGGSISPSFSPDTHAYTLTLDEAVSAVTVTPTASNKNYQIRTSVNGKEYQRTAAIPVSDGTVITVTCGDKSWPTMNDNAGDAQTYTLTVSGGAPEAEVKGYLSDLYFSEKNIKTTASKAKLVMTPTFDQNTYEYTVTVPTAQSKLYYFPTLSAEGKGKTITATYTNTSGEKKDVTVKSGAAAGGNLANCVAANSDEGNDVSITVGDQTYLIHLVRPIALTGLSIDAGAFDVTMDPKTFKADTLAYSATIPADVKPVLTFSGMASNYLRYSTDGGKDWIDLPSGGGQTAAISGDVETVLCQVADKTADWTKAVTYSVTLTRMTASLGDVTLLGAECAAGFYPPFSKENKDYNLVWKASMNNAVTFTVPEKTIVYFDGDRKDTDDGVLTVNFDVTKENQTLELSDLSGDLSLTYTFHHIVAGENSPDAVLDYLVINSQYTNSVNNAYGSFGLNPEITLAATDGSSAIGTSVKSLGNFGGYITYYYEDPIQDDPRNKYGMDFYVYGNANKDTSTGKGNGFFEPGQVWVSEDGKDWYALAGSAHYDPNVDWNYTVTYKKTADGKTAWTDNHGNDQSAAAGVGAWPLASNYYMNGLSKSDTIVLSGICLPTEKGDLVSKTDLPCVVGWGYADILPNGTLGADVNPYVDNSDYSSQANGFDLKWAVDADGLPVTVNNVHYIKVVTATNIWLAGVNEKSTEVQQVLRTVPQSASVGTTALPDGITVGDGSESVAVALKEGQTVYDVYCGDMTAVSVKVDAAKDDHVFINNRFASSGTTDETFAVSDTARLVRVIVQNGDSEPSIVLLKLKKGNDNAIPKLTESVSATAEVGIELGETYTLNLDSVFTDADGDELSYTVKIDDAAAIAADAEYAYTPAAAGDYTLVFKANDGTADSTDTYTVTLTVKSKESATAYDVTLTTVPNTVSLSLYRDAACTEAVSLTGESGTFTASLPAGTYYYRGTDGGADLGGGALTVTETDDQTFKLVRTNFYINNTNFSQLGDYTMSELKNNSTGALVTMGAQYVNANKVYTPSLLIGGVKYDGAVLTLADSKLDGFYPGTVAAFTVSATATAVQNKSMTATAYQTFTLIAPSDAAVKFYHQVKNFKVEEWSDGLTVTDNQDGTTTYAIKGKTTLNKSYMWRATKAGEVTMAGYLTNGKTETVSWLTDHTPTDTTTTALAMTYDDNSVLLNIDDTKGTNELAMQVGDTFKLRAFRNAWEIVSDVSGNYMTEPDFHFAILSGNDVVGVTPVTDAVSGNASGNWMNIKALNPGTAVIAVWYDGINISGAAQWNGFFGATNPARYGYVVVNVGEDATVAITPISQDGDWDAEFDTVYYADEAGGVFSFTSDAATAVTVTNLRGTVMGSPVTVAKDEDGKWNAPVFDGSNLLTITSAAGTDYRLVRAKKVNVTVTNVTTGKTGADEGFKITLGDTVSVTLDRLDMPLPKMSGLYNPGFGGTCKMVYMIDGQYTQVTKGTQYNFATPEVCTVTFVASKTGELHLGDGYITTGVFGSAPGAHRGITDSGVPVNTNAPESAYCFGKLPELTLTVEDGEALSAEDMTELTGLNIHVGYFSGMGTTKYVEFTAAKDTGAPWKSNPNANAYLSITAQPKLYCNTMSLTYWYEGENPKTAAVPANNELRIPVGDNWKVDTSKPLNLVFTIAPEGGEAEDAVSYHYVVMGGTAKLKYVHPVISALRASDGQSALSFDKAWNLTDTEYTLSVDEAETISLKATMLQQTVSATANTADKADTVTVQLMKDGTAVGDAVKAAPADENAYPTGMWALDDLDISKADALEITVTSYADSTVSRTYTIALVKGQPAVNAIPKLAESVSATAEVGIELGETYTLNLDSVFTDADGDELSYTVKIDDAAAIAADAEYAYTPAAAGDYTLVFKANDGTADSTDTYTVTLTVLEKGGEPEDYSDILEDTLDYLHTTVTDPVNASQKGEWVVLALSRGGVEDEEWFETYLENLAETADSKEGKLSRTKYQYTEYSRVIVALSALGMDAGAFKTDAAEYDLVSHLADMDGENRTVTLQGNNGTCWALIALDSAPYKNDALREELVSCLLAAQNADGGWPISSGANSDIDVTAMILTVLAGYEKDTNAAAAIENAIGFLKAKGENGYGSGEAAAQVVVALSALGRDAADDEALGDVLSELLSYYAGEGQFKHLSDGSANQMATEQAAYALVAYDRFQNDKTALYDMSDVKGKAVENAERLINSIGDATLESKAKIDAAREAYDALTELQQSRVENLSKLIAAEKTYQGLWEAADKEAADKAAAKGVDDLIAAIGDVTIESKTAIEDARAAYENLTSDEKAYVTNLDTLTNAEKTYEELKAADDARKADEAAAANAEALIAAIGNVTLESKGLIGAARAAYDALTDAQKALVKNADALTEAEKTYEKLKSESGNDPIPDDPDTITVYFTLLGDTIHDEDGTIHTLKKGNLLTWIAKKAFTLKKNATVKELLELALTEAGGECRNPSGNYVESITFRGVTIGEFDNTSKSGWMYTLNGTHPNLGVAEQQLSDGDAVVFHFTDDYTQEQGSEEWNTPTDKEDARPAGNQTEKSTDKFVDVPEDTYYTDAVAWAVENGITVGTDDTHFSPNAPCDRAQTVTSLWRAAGCPEPTLAKSPFTDLDENAYYYKAVLWAVENGITKGTSATTFSPTDTVTRAQVVTYLCRLAKGSGNGENPFTDVKDGEYYADAVNWAVANEVTKGTSATTFSPDADCVRAQIVTFLYRYFVK